MPITPQAPLPTPQNEPLRDSGPAPDLGCSASTPSHAQGEIKLLARQSDRSPWCPWPHLSSQDRRVFLSFRASSHFCLPVRPGTENDRQA